MSASSSVPSSGPPSGSLSCSLFALLLSCLAVNAALAQEGGAAVAAPPSQAIRYTVEIVGAGDFKALLENNLTIVERAGDAGLTDEELARRVSIAPQQIRDLLATEGYFAPRVEGSLARAGERPVARFTVELGAPVTIESVDLRFTGAVVGANATAQAGRIDRLRRQWTLGAGQRFRQAAWDGAKNELLKGLLVRDYPAARIAESQALVDPVSGNVRLSVLADSGPAFTFGSLQVDGIDRYGRARIDALNPIAPGMPYSQESLNELQARLQDTGYYRSAFTTIEVDPDKPDLVPVRVDLVENERKKLSFGVGISTDAGVNGRVKWLNRQFLGRDLRLESDLKLDRITQGIGSDLYFPALKNGLLGRRFDGWQPSVGAHYEATDENSEVNDKIDTSVRITSPDKDNEQSWAIQFFADRQKLPGADPNVRRALVGAYTYSRRRLDFPLSPTRGYVASIELSAGPAGLINEKNLARVLTRATWLHPFDRRWSAVLRGQVGQVFGAPRRTVPDDLLFSTGGDQSVRGYAFESLGVSQNGAIVGGRVLAVASAELVYSFTPQWGAAVFTDAGNAADSWYDFRFRLGSGVGARWRSPIGPVNVDIALPHDTWQPRLHFSVGYGF